MPGIAAAALLPEIGRYERKPSHAGRAPITRQPCEWPDRAFVGGGRKPPRDALWLPAPAAKTAYPRSSKGLSSATASATSNHRPTRIHKPERVSQSACKLVSAHSGPAPRSDAIEGFTTLVHHIDLSMLLKKIGFADPDAMPLGVWGFAAPLS